MDFDLREAIPEDRPGVLDVYNHYVLTSAASFEIEPVTLETRRPWFDQHVGSERYKLFVAKGTAGTIVGWASSSPFRPRAAYSTTVEASVYCRPEATGQGVGSRLYTRLFEALQDADVDQIVAGITLPNDPCLALHRRFGFVRVGTFRRIGRKFDRFWDVAWLQRPVRGKSGGRDPSDPRTVEDDPLPEGGQGTEPRL
jgi:phosphinothricin acetyltransferase